MNQAIVIGLPFLGVWGFDLSLWGVLGTFLLWAIAVVGAVWAISFPLFLFLSAPMRRQERTAMLLDLVEAGLKDGRTPEQTVTSVAVGVHRAMGMKFLILSACIQDGFRLSEALGRVPGIVAPQVQAMLAVGEETGRLDRVLPACRGFLRDGGAQVRGVVNYLPVLLLYLVPAQLVILAMIPVWILPKFQAIAEDMEVQVPGYSRFVFDLMEWALPLAAGAFLLVVLFVAGYLFVTVLGRRFPFRWLMDRVSLWMPWRRCRLHRDFCSMLSLLLDAGVAEDRSVQLAAQGTANSVFMKRAEEAKLDLSGGIRLSDALRRLEPAGEFHWRLANASHGASNFWTALAGWCEALDAKAFQQEQAASQLIASLLVLGNGLLVGLVATSIFLMLIGFIEEAVLW